MNWPIGANFGGFWGGQYGLPLPGFGGCFGSGSNIFGGFGVGFGGSFGGGSYFGGSFNPFGGYGTVSLPIFGPGFGVSQPCQSSTGQQPANASEINESRGDEDQTPNNDDEQSQSSQKSFQQQWAELIAQQQALSAQIAERRKELAEQQQAEWARNQQTLGQADSTGYGFNNNWMFTLPLWASSPFGNWGSFGSYGQVGSNSVPERTGNTASATGRNLPALTQGAPYKPLNKQGLPDHAKEFIPIVEKWCKKYNVDPNLIVEIIMQESGFHRYAVGPDGKDAGIMQLRTETARSLGLQNLQSQLTRYKNWHQEQPNVNDDRFNPDKNLEAGIRLIKNLLNEFNGNVRLAIAAYNAGAGGVRKSIRKTGDVSNPEYPMHILPKYQKRLANATE